MSDGKETARSIFQSFDILTLKNSVRLLCSLDHEDIEDFVKSYSSILIFLLNILDRDRAQELLARLNDASILYIVEEELRLHMIREIAHVSAAEDFALLSLFLDSIDDPRATPEPDQIEELLGLLGRSAGQQKIQFSYLTALGPDRARLILGPWVEKKPLNCLSILLFSDRELRALLIEMIVEKRPQLLSLVPAQLLIPSVRSNLNLFQSPGVCSCLPADIQKDIKDLENFLVQKNQALQDLYDKKGSNAVVSATLTLCKELRPGLQDYFLERLRNELIITEKEIQLLRSYQEAGDVLA
ncbi:MAG: hypothetical protein HS115_09200 [Spirochaetales bacterium]|nr:hypothetical protein [Spirochaetales bacterium]